MQCGIARIEEAEKNGAASPAHYRNTLQELQNLSMQKPAQSPLLYRFVAERPETFMTLPVAELGAVGNLALADHLFKQQRWQQAAERYTHVLASDDVRIKSRRDEILFHLAYCECKLEHWQRAAGFFNRLFKDYPASKLLAQAACVYYVAATQVYQMDKNTENYNGYISAVKRLS